MKPTTPSKSSLTTRLSQWVNANLLKTDASLQDLLEIRRARLLLTISLSLSLMNILAASLILALGASISGGLVLLAWAVFCLLAYRLGRGRRVQLGSLVLLVGTIFLGYFMIIDAQMGFDISNSIYSTFILAYVIGSALMDVRSLGVLMLVSNLGLLGLGGVLPGLDVMLIGQQVGIISAIGVLLLIVMTFRNGLEATRLDALQAANRELSEIRDTLEQRVEERTRSAETARREAEEARRQSEQAWLETSVQAWRDAGRVQLNEAMRGEQDLATLSEQVLLKICQIMDAQAGALYLAWDRHLRYTGGHAFVPGAGAASEYALGEGLIGQAAQDRKIKLIKGIEPDSLQPGSLRVVLGMGEICPRQLLVFPFLFGERLIGVIELATVNEFPEAGLNFLESVSESLGVAFHTAQARTRIDELLQQTQIQTEELQAREEELRAMNEELQAQAESVRRAQARKNDTDQAEGDV